MKFKRSAEVRTLLDGFVFVHKATLVKIIAANTDANEQEAGAIIETALTHGKRQVDRISKRTVHP